MFKPVVSAPNKVTPEEILKEKYTYKDLVLKLNLLGPQYKKKLLAEVHKPAVNYDFMCHTYSASYVLQWLYANKYISAKPFPVRSREAQDAKCASYTKIPKVGAKVNSFLSMRSISKKMGISNVGELLNGDELCALLNHCKTIDPNQNYAAVSVQIFNKDEYIKALIAAIDNNTPALIAFDAEKPIGFRSGQHEHVSIVVGYIQAADKTYFIITGYSVTPADTLFASTSQLESRYYDKSAFKLDSLNREITADARVIHESILKHYNKADSIKVSAHGAKVWFPVTRTFSNLDEIHNTEEVTKGLLPAKYQRKIATRQANKGWKNTIVIIKPVPIQNAVDSKPKMHL